MPNGGNYCSVPGCNNRSVVNGNLSFYAPKDEATKRKWEEAIENHTLEASSTKVLNVKRVCSAHFADDAYMVRDLLLARFGMAPKKMRLDVGAVPTIFGATSGDNGVNVSKESDVHSSEKEKKVYRGFCQEPLTVTSSVLTENPCRHSRPSNRQTAKSLLLMKEEARDPRALESSLSSSSDSQPEEMQLSSEFSGQLVRVKLEPPDVPCLPEEGQTQQQHCNESPSEGDADGVTAGIGDIKEEPREDSSNECPVVEVKTEPYNVPILTEQDQMRHSCDSTSEGTRQSTATLCIKDQSIGTCDKASSSCIILKAQLNITTRTVEPRFDNTELGTMDLVHLQLPGHLQLHMWKHTGEKPYKCDVCPAGFSSSSHLRVQKTTHTGEKPYKCDLCPGHFSQKTDLQRHKRTHTGEKPYKCDVCPAGFSHSSYLRVHKRTHTGEKPYKCDVCPAGFSQKTDLQRHKRTHTGEKPYKCDLCPRYFSQKTDLQRHKRTHTGEKPYKCDVCPAGFIHSSYLRVHKRTHTGEKPYECDVCPAAFNQKADLQRHKRTHTGEKPYKCDVCPARFIHSSYLRVHKRTHTGEKPYKCDVCPAAFSQKADLQRHKRKHTGEKP
ncbi:zinc finger protein ZFP2-like isoform X2 [Ornithodoros turicata]|uniref:zinc finger protein ZFP2-like isoform X2 n=1 Tax=Ornithodoros turicata TaxID=34597 RepID=UPI003138B97B